MSEIATLLELEELPKGSIGTTRDGELWLKTGSDEWMKIGSTRQFESNELRRIYGLPFRVIGSTGDGS